jgi:hypothetical protein
MWRESSKLTFGPSELCAKLFMLALQEPQSEHFVGSLLHARGLVRWWGAQSRREWRRSSHRQLLLLRRRNWPGNIKLLHTLVASRPLVSREQLLGLHEQRLQLCIGSRRHRRLRRLMGKVCLRLQCSSLLLQLQLLRRR